MKKGISLQGMSDSEGEYDGREQDRLRGVGAGADAGAVPLHEAGLEVLVEAGEKLMLKRGPKLGVFEVGVHPRERAGHEGLRYENEPSARMKLPRHCNPHDRNL